ncbi:MAG: orotidine-5'-phosphate decarboxylase [Candidatus Diapherotrites archaeon]|nr:orotidine-5'-phosphate decarboxylase [Candidatus Diapherotrites archaeon]
MNFSELLRKKALEFNSIVCFGADPVMNKIPIKGKDSEENIALFYSRIMDGWKSEDEFPSAVKPNYAFYAQHGFMGLRALKKVIEKAKEMKIPVILDVKRGDIGKTNTAYAKEAFDFWNADAMTAASFLGTDSVQPLLEATKDKPKGVYVLNRTSNKGANDFQSLIAGDKQLFLKISEKINEWSKISEGNLGAVVGATSMNELKEVSNYFVSQNNKIPFLIPGVGAQGGSASEVVQALKETGNDLLVHRINSSSGLNYAYLEYKTNDFVEASIKALKQLNKEIGKIEETECEQ